MWGHHFISDSCPNDDHSCQINYDIPIQDNFGSDLTFIYLTVLSVITICLIGVGFTKIDECITREKITVYRNLSTCMGIIFIIYNVGYYCLSVPEICTFNRSCHEGINNTIVETNYYYQMKKCPREPSLLTSYYSVLDENKDYTCSDSKYGCCELWHGVHCSIAGRDYKEYHDLLELIKNNSHWEVYVAKIDSESSNCPTIKEIIYKVSENDKPNTILLCKIYGIVSFTIMLLINIYRALNTKNQYEKTDVENQIPHNSIVQLDSKHVQFQENGMKGSA
jgi:hypothetical protein